MSKGKIFKTFTNMFYEQYKIPVLCFSRQTFQKVIRHSNSCQKVPSLLLSAFIPSFLVVEAFFKKKLPDEQSKAQEIIDQADSLYDKTQFGDLYTLLSSHNSSENPEILWRLARALFEKSKDEKDDKQRLLQLEEALDLVTKALAITDDCFAAHKWRAILLDYVWRNKSTKGRIIHSFDIRKHMERAIELNPKDSTSYYLLGEWCYTFADMPWYQRKAAAVIFASPPTSTFQEAIQFFQKAEENEPQFYSMNLLMLGKCHLKMGDNEKAVDYLKQAQSYPCKTSDDRQAKLEAEELLKKLNVT